MDIAYGELNGHVIGHVMKKCVQNAIMTVQSMWIADGVEPSGSDESGAVS